MYLGDGERIAANYTEAKVYVDSDEGSKDMEERKIEVQCGNLMTSSLMRLYVIQRSLWTGGYFSVVIWVILWPRVRPYVHWVSRTSIEQRYSARCSTCKYREIGTGVCNAVGIELWRGSDC